MGILLIILGLIIFQIVVFIVTTKYKANAEAKAFAKYTKLGDK